MDFATFIGTIASIVAIVGGVLAIISSLSKEPVFTRLWQHQPRTMSQPALQPPASSSTQVGSEASPTPAEVQQRQILQPSRVKPGIVYGLISGFLAILILLGIQTILSSYFILGVIGLVVLCIATGVLSARVSGSLLSAAIAGSILGVATFFIPFLFLLSSSYSNAVFVWTGFIILFAVLPFFVCMVFGLLGRYFHKRHQFSQ